MKRFAPAVLAILSGCAPSLAGGNAEGGMIQNNMALSYGAGFKKAQAHCAQFGKDVVISGQHYLENTTTFTCVERK